MRKWILLVALFAGMNTWAAYQYNATSNGGGYFTFTSDSSFSLDYISQTGGKVKATGFFSYNPETGAVGTFEKADANGKNSWILGDFSAGTQIGIWLQTARGDLLTSTGNILQAKEDGSYAIVGSTNSGHGTHGAFGFEVEFKENGSAHAPSGQPLPGVLATLLIGGGALGVKRFLNRKKETAR